MIETSPDQAAHLPLPEVVLNKELDGWILLGYDGEEKLLNDQPANLKLYWIAPVGVEPTPSPGFQHVFGRRWIQEIPSVHNLVTNGDFERETSVSNFPGNIYNAPPETRQLATDFRAEHSSTVALLQNTTSFSRSSFVSIPINIDPASLYFHSGWMRSEAGMGFLGRQWLPSQKYDYVAAEVRKNEWLRYDQIVRPPDKTTQAQVWLLNFDSTGAVYFDDIIFVELGQANPDPCRRVSNISKPTICQPPVLPPTPQ
jgi:hypothetical protein